MKKIIIAPDSFKGSLSATEVCDIVGGAFKEKFPDINIVKIPIADGGEGTVEAYLSIFGGEKVYCEVESPLGRRINAYYGILSDKTAVIEMAQASGITIEDENNALLASTYGTGELIKNALDNGAKKIILGLGGSATTDGGVGCVQALGGHFTDKEGNEIKRGGVNLSEITAVDLSSLDARLKEIELTVLCDVKNPLYGETGAAYIYSRQKGADDEQIRLLDSCLVNLSKVSKTALGKDYSLVEGAGAAGGMGFACVAFLGGTLKSGIDTVLENADFENEAKDADLVITGEGKMDIQSLMGKAPFGVASRAGKSKVMAFVGLLDADRDKAKELGISEIYETNPEHKPFEEILPTAKQDLKRTAELYLSKLN